MVDFVPPFPERPRGPLSALATLRAARRNVLTAFDEKCFEYQFFSTRVLNRRLFICNSPDTPSDLPPAGSPARTRLPLGNVDLRQRRL